MESAFFRSDSDRLQSFFLRIKTISLADFYFRIIINPDKTTNIQHILSDDGKKEPEEKEPPAKSAEKKKETKPSTKPADIKIGKIIFRGGNIDFRWQALVNLITKAVTSPFALISSLTGGGEELSFIEFDYGSTAITDEGHKKITTIGKALYERPAMKLDIEGYVDTVNDKAGLKKDELNRRIKSYKLKEMLSKSGEQIALEQLQLTREEYEKYLKITYDDGKFTKPRNFLGIAKKIPAEEMGKLLLNSIEVTDSDLRQLAARRAQNVKELLLQSGNIDASRVFIVETKTLSPEKKEKVKDSRVNFKLK